MSALHDAWGADRRAEFAALRLGLGSLDRFRPVAAMAFLEEFLISLTGIVLVASHDRTFLDKVCAAIVDLYPMHLGVDGEAATGSRAAMPTLGHKRDSRRRWELAFLDQQEELNDLRRAAATTARQVAHNRAPRHGDKAALVAKDPGYWPRERWAGRVNPRW